MNERIQELAEQARKALATDAMSGGEFNMKAYEEKFAELIVRECVEVCNGQATYDPQTLPYKPSKQFADAIKEHFGVKE